MVRGKKAESAAAAKGSDNGVQDDGSRDGVAFKKGIKVALSGSRGDPFRHLLADATDTDVLVVLENAMRFMGETAPPVVAKDAPELPLGGDDQQTEDAA